MADEKKLELGIAVSEDLVKKLVIDAVAKSLGNAETIVESIVKSAMEAPGRDHYGGYGNQKMTLWQQQVEELIRKRATEVFQEWLKQHDAMIREALMKALTKDKAGVIAKIVANLSSGLTNFGATVRLDVLDRER